MYKKFFGLKENPFNVNPHPCYLFLTHHTQEALACLTYGIETRKGFILLTGEVGTGKTTLINTLWSGFTRKTSPRKIARGVGHPQFRNCVTRFGHPSPQS